MTSHPSDQSLQLKQVSLRVGERLLFEQLNESIRAGEILTLMGPSGSGKSTLLKWLLGIGHAALQASGEAWLNDKRIDNQLPEKRRIGLMFQDDGLFNHLNTEQNLLIAISNKHPKPTRLDIMRQALKDANLAGYEKRSVDSLSGGERSRIALLRTLLSEPDALLLDEPFSALDETRREKIREFTFARIQQESLPTVLVTHDPADIPAQFSHRVIRLD